MHNPMPQRSATANDIVFLLEQTTLGILLMAMSSRGICVIAMSDDQASLIETLHAQFPLARPADAACALNQHLAHLRGWLDNPAVPLSLPLDIQGTEFQQRVWHHLQTIQPGQTISYSELARQLGKSGATRAVATACAANRLALAIPCHRVIRQDGHLGGYRWGLTRKRRLLEKEAHWRNPLAVSAHQGI